ncbi:MAG: hypothetical protein IAG10_03030, partial [Planctomycetaceae bacterium]|nr:hypothetical protein [Planctomycetaceae bacterium]
MLLSSWMESLKQVLRTKSLRTRHRPGNAGRQSLSQMPAQFESLESRCYLSVSSVFDSMTNTLTITSDAKDAIKVGANADGMVTVNKSAISPAVNASAVQMLVVTGGAGANTIDLSAISTSVFTSLTSVTVNGGAGADRITGTALADNLNGGEGND